jgi:inositol 1,4,5-triphosphate receptor type 1
MFLSVTMTCVQGGSVIRLFHKELEAYLVAEGLFEEEVTEDGKQTNLCVQSTHTSNSKHLSMSSNLLILLIFM